VLLEEAVVGVPLVEDGAEEVDFSDYDVYAIPIHATLFPDLQRELMVDSRPKVKLAQPSAIRMTSLKAPSALDSN